jgi:hypothetical protein
MLGFTDLVLPVRFSFGAALRTHLVQRLATMGAGTAGVIGSVT